MLVSGNTAGLYALKGQKLLAQGIALGYMGKNKRPERAKALFWRKVS
jgi:hypothetical protein